MALRTNKGIEQLEKSFASATGGVPRQQALPEAPEVMDILKESLNNITAAHGASELAKVVRTMVTPEQVPQPDTLDSIIKAKEAGLIDQGDKGAFSATAQLLSSMLAEQGKVASEARQENKQLTESMIGMIVDNMQNQNRAAIDEIGKKLDMSNSDPFQTAVKQAMAAMLMQSLGDLTNPRAKTAQPQQVNRSMGDLVKEFQDMEQVYTHLSGFFKRREESVEGMGQNTMRNQWMNPEILRATLEDDRARLQMQMEQKRIEQSDQLRRETMDKADKIIGGLAPLIAQALASRQAMPTLARNLQQAQSVQLDAQQEASSQPTPQDTVFPI